MCVCLCLTVRVVVVVVVSVRLSQHPAWKGGHAAMRGFIPLLVVCGAAEAMIWGLVRVCVCVCVNEFC